MVLAEAINIAGKLDGDAIMDVIKNTAFDAPYYATGKVKFNEKGQNEVPASYVVQTQDKKYQAVYPKDTATADPIVPFPDWSQR